MLTFVDVGEGLRIRNGDKLNEFAIAGADHKWHWAEAKIVGKNRVEVWSATVPQPLAVRYAFNNNPKNPNLTNETGLPAGPFRTDNWPGPTDGKEVEVWVGSNSAVGPFAGQRFPLGPQASRAAGEAREQPSAKFAAVRVT